MQPTAPADVLLADGTLAVVRPLHADDRDGLLAMHEESDDRSLRMRFFSLNRAGTEPYVDHLLSSTDPTGATFSLVATVAARIVGVATAERVAPDTSEVAFLVSPQQQGQGVGSLLLEHLAAAARDAGVRRFTADVLAENHSMMRVFLDAGFEVTRQLSQGIVGVEMETSAASTALEAADMREAVAEARSLAPLLYPRTVAVVGVRSDGGGIGHAVLRSIVEGGYQGHLFVVHPRAEELGDVFAGVQTRARLADVGKHVDLVVVAVPAERVLDVVSEAAEAQASCAVVLSSGFGELGEHGADLQRRMLRIARDHNLRLVGPNCLGVMSNDPAVGLNATFARGTPPPGGLAIASQSGGVGIAMLDVAREMGLGVGSFISLGNKADVSSNDLLAAWVNDERVTGAALYLESFGNARKFARIARRFAERKPLLAVVGGRSASGQRAGASHTAAAASPTVGVDALFAQAGVIGCRDAESMARAAKLLAGQPLPRGPRLAVVSNAGGLGVLAADAADTHGLVVPELSAPVRSRIDRHVTGTVGTSNPVDLGAGATGEHVVGVVEPLLETDEIDVVLVVLAATSVEEPGPLVDALADLAVKHTDKPLVFVGMGGMPGGAGSLTAFRSADEPVEAISQTVRYAQWLSTPRSQPAPPDPARAAAARSVAARLLRPGDESWLSAEDTRGLLAPYGLAPVGTVVHDAEAAARAATELGFPVAVKVADETVVHKTDRGLVRVNQRTAEAVAECVRAFRAELGRHDMPVLVQPMVEGVEIALGVVRDPGFGPMVMVAAGGVAVNVWNDRAFLLPPISDLDAARALRSLRIWPLLEGYRGSARVDVDDVAERIVALGQLAADVREVAELDINPVIATPAGCVLVDVKVRLAEGASLDDGVPRRLRSPF